VGSKIGKPHDLPTVDEARAQAVKRREAVYEAINVNASKPAKDAEALEKVIVLKDKQREERKELVARQQDENAQQERSFVEKIFGHIKSVWTASADNLARLRDKWSGRENAGAPPNKDVMSARQSLEDKFRTQRDALREQHLTSRRALQGDLLREHRANQEKIIFERRQFIRGTDVETRKAMIRDKLRQDRLKSRDHER